MTLLKAPVAESFARSTIAPPFGNLSENQPPILSPMARNGANGSNPPPPLADAGRPPMYFIGSTGLPPVQVSKCKCGPVLFPVLPDRPITCPLATSSPADTSGRDKCP